jgi:hypothetical protein
MYAAINAAAPSNSVREDIYAYLCLFCSPEKVEQFTKVSDRKINQQPSQRSHRRPTVLRAGGYLRD